MLSSYIDFAKQFTYEQQYNLYSLGLKFNNNNYTKEDIMKMFNQNNKFVITEEIVFEQYYDLSYYYEFNKNIDKFNKYLSFIMDSIK